MEPFSFVTFAASAIVAVVSVAVTHWFADRRQRRQIDETARVQFLLQDRAEQRKAVGALVSVVGDVIRVGNEVAAAFHGIDPNQDLGQRAAFEAVRQRAWGLRHDMMGRFAELELYFDNKHPLYIAAFSVIGEATRFIGLAEKGEDLFDAGLDLTGAAQNLKQVARKHLKLELDLEANGPSSEPPGKLASALPARSGTDAVRQVAPSVNDS